MVLSAEQERVRSLIADTVSLLCKNGLHYTKEFSIEGLLGITLDHDEVFLVNIKEIVKTEMSKDYLESGSGSEESTNPNPSSRRRRRKRQRKNTGDGVESDSDNEMNSSVHGGRDNSSKKNIKLEDNDSGDDLVFVKNEPGLNHSNNFSSNFSGLSGATSATNDILGDLSQQGQLYATPTSNPLPSPSWDPHHSTNSLYNTPNHQQAMNVMSPTASPGGSMQHMGQQQVALLQQLSLSASVNTLACKFCGKTFRSEQGLKDHENAHKGKYRYNCSHCSRGFVAINHYKEHLTGHTGVGYFTCKLCGEKLPSQYQMKIHKNKEHPEEEGREIVQRGGLSAVQRELGRHPPPLSPASAAAGQAESSSSSQQDHGQCFPPQQPEMSYGEMVANQILAKAGLSQVPTHLSPPPQTSQPSQLPSQPSSQPSQSSSPPQQQETQQSQEKSSSGPVESNTPTSTVEMTTKSSDEQQPSLVTNLPPPPSSQQSQEQAKESSEEEDSESDSEDDSEDDT